jgi:hypothetical protein
MKTKSVVLAVLMSASAMAFAGGPGNFKLAVVDQKESGIFKVIYQGEHKGKVELSVQNSEGIVVYRDVLKDIDNFALPLNFKQMTYGEYTIAITDNTGKKIQKVTYGDGIVSAPGSIRLTKIDQAGKYLYSVANAGSEEVNVKIYDGASVLVHDQTLAVHGSMGLIYNLQKVSGEPTFTVTDKAGIVKVIK